MDSLTIQTITAYAGGKLRRGDSARLVSAVVSDTRALEPGQLFVALSGENFDGHAFIAQAERAGAVGAMVAPSADWSACGEDFAIIEVPEVLRGYQLLATAYRSRLPMKVVAITGSNGKTSTKDFTAAVLGQRYRVLKTEGNLNNHIGVPRMLLRAAAADEVAVLEMGMNHPGEIAPLAAMACPDLAIITNIGTAHIEFMLTQEAIALEKGMLVESIGRHGHVILPAEDPFTPSLAARTSARVLTAGLQKGDVRAENLVRTLAGTRFEVVFQGERATTSVPVPGDHMIVNALLAVGAGLALGLPLDAAAQGLASTALTKGRLQVRWIGDLQVVDDSYNANPDSMVAALNTLGALSTAGRRIAVLGRMGELGVQSAAGHRRVGSAAAAAGFDCVITVGDEAALIARSATAGGVPGVHECETNDEAADLLDKLAGSDDVILVKGSRSAGMEQVIARLASRRGAAASVPQSTLK